jgi:hypothetical protein
MRIAGQERRIFIGDHTTPLQIHTYTRTTEQIYEDHGYMSVHGLGHGNTEVKLWHFD